jgi:hypothetical protein
MDASAELPPKWEESKMGDKSKKKASGKANGKPNGKEHVAEASAAAPNGKDHAAPKPMAPGEVPTVRIGKDCNYEKELSVACRLNWSSSRNGFGTKS